MKNAKRLFALLMTLVMLCATVAAIPVTAASKTKVANNNPYILATVGKEIFLSDYEVDFGGTVSSSCEFKNGDEVITKFTAKEAGVTPLTVSASGKTRTVYVVAKNSGDNEYVLYSKDLTKVKSLSELKSEGYTVNAAESNYQFSSNGMTIGSLGNDYVRITLPQWLADFGDYSVSAEFKMLSTTDTGRWCSIVYRGQSTGGTDGNRYPYMHMCMRENTTLSNGIEYAERTSGNAWNVITTMAHTVSSLKNAYHTANVTCKGQTVQYNMDGEQLMYIDGLSTVYQKGYVGFTVNYATVSVKNFKVVLQTEEIEKAAVQLKLASPDHDNGNVQNPIANIQKIGKISKVDKLISSKNHPGNVIIDIAGENVSTSDIASAIKKLVEADIIPGFEIESETEAKNVAQALKDSGKNDAFIVSSNAAALKAGRSANKMLRSVLELDDIGKDLTSKQAHELRVKVRSSGSTSCIIDVDDADKALVAELQELAVAVWVDTDEDDIVDAAKAITSGANGIVSDDASVISKYLKSLFADNTMTRTPSVIAHRGASVLETENSMKAFKAAYERGADVFEIDVDITSDGEIIIMHDNTINRTTNYTGTKTINQMSLDEIRQYKLKNGEDVPTFKELCEYFKDKDIRIFIEIKGSNGKTVAAVAKLLKQYGMEDRVDFISFGASFLNQIQSNITGMSTGYLMNANGVSNNMDDAINNLYTTMKSALLYNSTININYGTVSKYFNIAATDRGITVWPWTFATTTNQTAWNLYTDGITTNNCEWFEDMFKTVSGEDKTLAVGEEIAITVNGTTYGRKTSSIKPSTVKILEGDDIIKVDGDKITALKDGTATVIMGYSTKTKGNSTYVLYTQPVEITVTASGAVSEPDESSIDAGSDVSDISQEPVSGDESTPDESSSVDADSDAASTPDTSDQNSDNVTPDNSIDSADSSADADGKQNGSMWWIIIVVVALIAVAAIVFIIVKKKK